MSRRAWLAVVGTLLLLAVVVAAIALPRLVDVERHRQRIELALSDATGWQVEVGELDLSVLRGLAVTASPVRLSAPEGGSRLDVGTVGIRADFRPLLRGELRVRQVDLLQPEIRLLRPSVERGWILPDPGGPSEPSAEPAEGGGGFAVSVEQVRVANGALRLEDRSVDPPLTLALEDLDTEVDPIAGGVRGSATLDGGGRVSWNGVVEALQVVLEDVESATLAPWLGGMVHGGGRIGGEITLALPDEVTGHLILEELSLLAGETPLSRAELDFRLVVSEGALRADRLELRSGSCRVQGRGMLVPDLALDLELRPTDLETAQQLARALFPLPLELAPPGSVQAAVRLRQPADGDLTYDARGELSAARFSPGSFLPDASDLRTTFELTPAGALELTILGGTVGGGPLAGSVRIDRIDPPGTLTFDGKLDGASLGTLLGGMIDQAPQRISGPVELQARLALDLGQASPDARALGGRVSLGAREVDLAGWDLEQALRSELREKLGALAGVASLLDPRLAEPGDAQQGRPGSRRLLERLNSDMSFDGLPWDLQRVELSAGGVHAAGSGTFDPLAGTVDVRFVAELDEDLTRDYVQRFKPLRSLVTDAGRLSLPLRVRGPLTRPGVDVDLAQLRPDSPRSEGARGVVEGLLKGLLEREDPKKD